MFCCFLVPIGTIKYQSVGADRHIWCMWKISLTIKCLMMQIRISFRLLCVWGGGRWIEIEREWKRKITKIKIRDRILIRIKVRERTLIVGITIRFCSRPNKIWGFVWVRTTLSLRPNKTYFFDFFDVFDFFNFGENDGFWWKWWISVKMIGFDENHWFWWR